MDVANRHSDAETYALIDAETHELLDISHTPVNDTQPLAPYDESSSIRIDALHLKKFGNKREILLNDISLAIPPRSFVAIIGASGAGKSMLLDALNGLRPASEGKVLYNGHNYYQQPGVFNRQLGYVPQDDIVHRELTVERALYYAARMRLPGDFTREQINRRIDEVLDEVDMKGRRRLLISQLSGGQRKRVSIALELLDKPSIFFLDEPTSGLDPGLDRRMMLLLRKLADKGHTIVLVTHATSNITICDYICFLAQGGRMVYFGPPDRARAYFGKTDFAEIYSTLEFSEDSPNAPAEAEERFKASADYQHYVTGLMNQGPVGNPRWPGRPRETKRPRCGNQWRQFCLLFLRYLELLKNDPGNLLILFLQAPIIALFIVLLMRYEVSSGIFLSEHLVKCPTTAAILTTAGRPDIPAPAGAIVSTSCERVETFLKNNPDGKLYAKSRGGERVALQDFIALGSGVSTQEILFIMGFSAVLFGCVNAAREIVKEAPIYRRERAINLGILPYLGSKIAVLALLCLLQSALLVVIIHTADPFQQGILWPALLEVYITLALASLVGLMMGLAISAIAPSTDRAMSLIPIILIPQVIFSGTVFPFKDAVPQLFSMIFATRWSIGALGSIVGLHSDKIAGDMLFGNEPIYQGTLFSTYQQADAIRYLLLMWLALGIMTVLLACVTGMFLKKKDIRT